MAESHDKQKDLRELIPAALRPQVDSGPSPRVIQAVAPHDLDRHGRYEDGFLVLTDTELGCFAKRAGSWQGEWLPVKEFTSYYPFFAQRVDFDRIVIVYCTGHECTDSLELAALLTQKGYRLVQVYKGGMSEWQERKFDVER